MHIIYYIGTVYEFVSLIIYYAIKIYKYIKFYIFPDNIINIGRYLHVLI